MSLVVRLRTALFFAIILSFQWLFAQFDYNHPELKWQTFETEHFYIHFYDKTINSAIEGAAVAEKIYPEVTQLYQYEPPDKTHLIFMDTDDIANGAAYYYDNKIIIWASPLDYELRGSHRWLQDVVTHEFTHIVSIQKSMKAGQKYPAIYFQWIGYEPEKRNDVLFGYPNQIVSFAVPGTLIPPWFAEGMAQFQFKDSDYDIWDTHRDMILRDRTMHNNLLSFPAMCTFGKTGIGNESVYNSGFALTRYIAVKYGPDKIRELMTELAKPAEFSFSDAVHKVLGMSADDLYDQFVLTLKQRYNVLTETVRNNPRSGQIILKEGTTNLYPVWDAAGTRFLYISNKGKDYFGQTDLYLHDMDSGKDVLIDKGVKSAATWSPNGKTVFYSRRPKHPNVHGSIYNDLFAYNLKKKKPVRLTEDSRGRSPVYIPIDSSLAYISVTDGMENIFLLSLKDKSISQLTDFKDHRLVHHLNYIPKEKRIVFDVTVNHFRNVLAYDFADSTIRTLLNTREWDERDLTVTPSGNWLYADDRSGIFNLYQIQPGTQNQSYVTNVLGGAFMPDVNAKGQCVYVEYSDGGYKIAMMDSLQYVSEDVVGYSPNYYLRNSHMKPPILEPDTKPQISEYEDQFVPMFILPRLTMDYHTLKPGFYFYSDEVLHRLNVFGGASVNRKKDLDLYFRFEFHRLFPTLYFETTFLTRSTLDNYLYSDAYKIDDRLRFQLVEFRTGMLFPLFGQNTFEIYGNWQQYRAFVTESVPTENGVLIGKTAYDYFRGNSLVLHWHTDAHIPRFDQDINPSNGFKLDLHTAYEWNNFIDKLDLSDAGTLLEIFKPNNLFRVEGNFQWAATIPHTNRWTIASETIGGWISNKKADTFFDQFAGGLPGIQGYPFYSIEGRNLFVERFAFRIPIFEKKNFKTGWWIWQNSVIGILYQFGDAWDSDFSLKQSLGFQWRINGFSFYNFPIAFGWEIHRGLSSFTRTTDQGQTVSYGNENRYYITILFGF